MSLTPEQLGIRRSGIGASEAAACGFDGCDGERWSRGLCSAHYQQRRKGQGLRPLRLWGGTPEERLWSRVDRSGGQGACWPWLGARIGGAGGYGEINVGGRPIPAHRLAWESMNGTVPDGLWVLHSCDNPPCCNPSHLRIGTRQDNIADAVERRRTTIGERNPMARLTTGQVREIRACLAVETDSALGRRFGVNPATIREIRIGRNWRRVA